MELFETVDIMFIRGVLKAQKSSPKELLFLKPAFREIIRQRTLGFLYYTLNQFKVFKSQIKSRTSKEWATAVLSNFK